MPTLQPIHDDIYLWKFVPSIQASIALAAIFAVATGLHLCKMVIKGTWFCVPLVAGGVLEVAGYVIRAMCHAHTDKEVPFVLQHTLLLLPPVLFAASLYMVYPRLVRAVDSESFSLISSRKTTCIFVASDVVLLVLQTAGSVMQARSHSSRVGETLVEAGLLAHIALFLFFLLCCAVFHIRYQRYVSVCGLEKEGVSWSACLAMLYTTSSLITARNGYRVAAYFAGSQGYLQMHEWPLFVFDSVPMLLAMAALYLWYPNGLWSKHRSRGSLVDLMQENNSVRTGPRSKGESISSCD